MGLGKGKGFTTKYRIKIVTYRAVAVQGSQPTITETNPTYTASVS